MNWTIIVSILIPCVTVFGTVYQTVLKGKNENEETYASHMPEFWDRMDKLTNERDDLKIQVEDLNKKVEALTLTIQKLERSLERKGDI